MNGDRIPSSLLWSCRVFGAPRRYVQGPGALGLLGSEVAALGGRACVVCSGTVRGLLANATSTSLSKAGVAAAFALFEDEVTAEALDALCTRVSDCLPEVVVAMGGGKTIDAAKAAAARCEVPLVVVPTLASNDAPTSRLVVVYDCEHRLLGVERFPWNPDVVLVDTAVIARAPERFLVAGIGDAVAKRFEANASARSERGTFFGGRPTAAGLSLAGASYEVLRQHGLDACRAVRQRRPNQALEAVVEACLLLAGLGFENSGIFLAHSLTRGLSLLPQTHDVLHGELVAYGLLVQLVQEERPPAFVLDLMHFYRDIGLPCSLQEIGLGAVAPQELLRVTEVTMDAPYMEDLRDQLRPQELLAYVTELERMAQAVGAPVPRTH